MADPDRTKSGSLRPSSGAQLAACRPCRKARHRSASAAHAQLRARAALGSPREGCGQLPPRSACRGPGPPCQGNRVVEVAAALAGRREHHAPRWFLSGVPLVTRYSIRSFGIASVTVSSKGRRPFAESRRTDPTPFASVSTSLTRVMLRPSSGSSSRGRRGVRRGARPARRTHMSHGPWPRPAKPSRSVRDLMREALIFFSCSRHLLDAVWDVMYRGMHSLHEGLARAGVIAAAITVRLLAGRGCRRPWRGRVLGLAPTTPWSPFRWALLRTADRRLGRGEPAA